MRVLVYVLAVLLMMPLAARAADDDELEFDVDIARTVICDTQAQVERFVGLFDGDFARALDAVNGEQEIEPACDVAVIAFVPHEDVSIAQGPVGRFRVIRITLVGLLTEKGFRFAVPATYFIMLPDRGRVEVRAR